MANILNPSQNNAPFKSFIKRQFNYCPLLWMLFSRLSNNFINKIHEKPSRLTSEISFIPFKKLLSINNEVSVHYKNIQILLVEVFKNLSGLLPPIMFDLFTARGNIYKLRNI